MVKDGYQVTDEATFNARISLHGSVPPNGGTDLGRCKSGDFYSQDPHLCTKECREITGSGDFSAWYEPGPWVSAESDAMECAGRYRGFIVTYPLGNNNMWDTHGTSDVEFVDAVIQE